jgi:nucleotide-binding universal stress UspA family protein
MAFRKIMCPTDFSPGARDAIRLAVRMAVASGAELVIAHVWHPPMFAFGGGDPFPAEAIHRLVADRERRLATAVEEARALGAPRVVSQFLTGAPWDQIVEALQRDDTFDLVVTGSHGRTGVARLLLGSVTEKVIRHAPCSVLAARAHHDTASFSHVLCPIDFSDAALGALDRAAALAAPGGAGIKLLHVIEMPTMYSPEVMVADFIDDIEHRSAHMLASWATTFKAKVTVPVTTELRLGNPAVQALAMLDDDPTYDLVVMGSHGRTGLRRALLGSVAEKVVRHAPCPVFVARTRAA